MKVLPLRASRIRLLYISISNLFKATTRLDSSLRQLCVLLFSTAVLSANAQVTVNNNTGTAHFSLPVYTVQRGNVAVPVSLEYDAKGIRINDPEGPIGTGWQLSAGGAINRELRDLPDDIKADIGGRSRMGWMYTTNATKVNNFLIGNDNNPATCVDDEATDINYLTANFSDSSDLEPDIFHVQAPGLNCKLIFDKINGVFRTIPYADIQVSYTLNAAQNSIISFVITNDKGTKFQFDVTEAVTKTTSTTNLPGVLYFKREFYSYRFGVNYNQKWYLSRITDVNGNYVTLTYNNALTTRNFSSPVRVCTGTNTMFTDIYSVQQVFSVQCLTSIKAYNKITSSYVDEMKFNYTATTDDQGVIISSINLNVNKRTLVCTYRKVPGRKRDYLVSFGESGCSAGGIYYNSNLHQFEYKDVDFTMATGIPDQIYFCSFQDYWGYMNLNADVLLPNVYVYPDNGSYPNLERYRISSIPGYPGTTYTLGGELGVVDPTTIAKGTLSKIIYPTGGSTTLIYEPNDYKDNWSGTAVQGGGLRIKQIVDYDGLDVAVNIVKNFTYTDPATSLTSGKPVALPVCAFSIPYTGAATGLAYWQNSTVRIEPGRSNQNETILYSKVTVQQTGAGKTIYEYSNPATFWDLSAGTDWTPTVSYSGRVNIGASCPAIGSLKNATHAYPFPPDPNYDFERGLLTKATNYNESNKIVSSSVYTYQRSNLNALPIYGVKFEQNGSAYNYSKYKILTNTSELISTETKYINDLTNITDDPLKRFSTSTAYSYSSANHKYPTIIERTNTDGTKNRVYTKYSKDYVYQVGDVYDASMGAIKNLSTLNVNIPIEQYTSIIRASIEKYLSGEISKFGTFATGLPTPANMYLPTQKLAFVTPSGAVSFQPSYNNAGAFTIFSGYLPIENYTAYNNSGSLLSKNDNFKNVTTQIVDDRLLLPVAAIENANYNEIAYSNFDGADTKYGFSGGGSNTTGRTGVAALSMTSGTTLLANLSLRTAAKNYIFSTWIKTTTTGQLTLTINNSGGTVFTVKNIACSNSGGNWVYLEQKFSTVGLTSTFTAKIQSNFSLGLDDILVYPEEAEVATYSFDPDTFLKTSETSASGVSRFFTYDGYYRPEMVLDQDRNIVNKKTYASASTISTGLINASFTTVPSTGLVVNSSVNFSGLTGSGICTPGTKYTWNFGDGTGVTPESLSSNQAHTFVTAGNYSVAFNAVNPIYGSKSITQLVSVAYLVNACQSGVYQYWPATGTRYTETCASLPSDNNNSYFKVTSITAGPAGAAYTYQWQIYYLDSGGSGSGVWTNISGATSVQYTKPFVPASFRPFKVRCNVIETTTGISAMSGEFFVVIGNGS